VPEALDKPWKTLDKVFAECDTRQRGLVEQYISNGFFAEYFLSGTRQILCWVSLGTRQRKVTVTAPGNRDNVFAECLPFYTHQRRHQRVPLSVSLPSALGGTRQSLLLCRVSGSQHSAKNLYRCPGFPFLPSAMSLTLDKAPLCGVLHSAKWPVYTFFICFCYSIQTNKDITYTSQISHNHHRYHIYITYLTNTINQTSSHNITNMFGHKHKYPTLTSSDRVISQSMNNNKKDNISSMWAAGLVRRWLGNPWGLLDAALDCLSTEKRLYVLYQMHYQHLTIVLILTGVWNRAGSTIGNNGGGGGKKPRAAPRLCMYWNISAILCWSAMQASRSAIILASISWRSLLSISSWFYNIPSQCYSNSKRRYITQGMTSYRSVGDHN
jgi:hypothetical protein